MFKMPGDDNVLSKNCIHAMPTDWSRTTIKCRLCYHAKKCKFYNMLQYPDIMWIYRKAYSSHSDPNALPSSNEIV